MVSLKHSTLEGSSLCSFLQTVSHRLVKELISVDDNVFRWKKTLNLKEISVSPKQRCTINNFLNQHLASLLPWSSAACHLIWAWNLCCLISYAGFLLKTGKTNLLFHHASYLEKKGALSSGVVTISSTPHLTNNRILESWQKSLNRIDNVHELE